VIHMPIRLVLLALLAVATTGCIQLTGQRLAWHHDVKADTFTALLFYDGIHDKSDTPREIETSKQRLREFVDQGDIMLLDWFGELKIGQLQSLPPEQLERKPDVKALLPALKHVRTTPIGHYTESGQIGAAQLIEIRGVSQFLKKFNGYINQMVLAKPIDEDQAAERVRTDDLRHQLAAKGHAWFSLDHQAVVIALPFDRDDWARRKADGLSDMIESFLKTPPVPTQPGEREEWETARMFTQLFTATPVSIDHRGEIVRFTIGGDVPPNVARATIRSSYNTHHVETVKKAVPNSLHDQIVAVATGGEGQGHRKDPQKIEASSRAVREAEDAGRDEAEDAGRDEAGRQGEDGA